MSDSQAIESTWRAFEQRPDAATFEAFYTAGRDLAARIAWRALGDSDWMEDAMQALFARLWQDRATRRLPEGLTAREALIRWTLNECRTLNRRRARNARREAPIEAAFDQPARGPSPGEAADHHLIAEAVRRLLATMPDPYREALVACEIEGATHAEAGTILGLPARTIQTHVRRGRELLARKLRKAGITLPAGAALAVYAADTHAAIQWTAASDIIANASSTVTAAGAIAPSEGVAAASVFTLPVMTTAAACLAGIAALVWMMATPTTNPPGVAASGATDPAGVVAMAEPADSGTDNTQTDTNVAQSATNERSGTASGEGGGGSERTALESDAGIAQDPSMESQPIGETFPAAGRIIAASTREGIAGVEVGLASNAPESDASTIALEVSVRTDADGYFFLPGLTEEKASGHGMIALHARGDGLASRTVLLISEMFFAGDPPLIEIPMPSGASISGVLHGPTGAPVADASIGFPIMGNIDVSSAMEKGYFITSGSVTTTNGRGEFTLDGLPAGESIDIPIRAKDLPPRFQEDILAGTRDHRFFIEDAGQTLSGLVTHQGQAVAQAIISTNPLLEMHSEPQDIFRSMIFNQSATSGPDGRFEMRGMAPGEYRGGVSTNDGYGRFEVVIKPGQDATVEVDIPVRIPPASIPFLAVDAETGETVQGVRLSRSEFVIEIPGRRPRFREPEDMVTTDRQGLARLVVGDTTSDNLPLNVLPPHGWIHAQESSGQRVTWHPIAPPQVGETEPRKIHLLRAEILRGRILDVDGKTPAADVWLWMGSNTVPAISDEAGRFELPLLPDESVTLLFHGQRGGLLHHIERAGSGMDRDFTLQPYAIISGRIEDIDGSAVPLLSLSAHHLAPSRRSISSPTSFAVTSPEGRFLLRDVIPGSIVLRMNTSLETPSRLANLTYETTLAPGETRRDVLLKPESGRTFEGVVTNDAAEPIPGVYVSLSPRREPGIPGPGTRHTGRTDAEGYWRIEHVPDIPIESAQFSRDGYNDFRILAEEGQSLESPLNAMLIRLNTVRLHLRDHLNGAAILHYRATQFDPRMLKSLQSEAPVVVHPDAEGLSPATPARQGPYYVRVEELDEAGAPTGRSTVGLFEIGSGGETQVLDLYLGGLFTVNGGVGLIPGWHPVEGARVTVGDFSPGLPQVPLTGDGSAPEAFTDANGNFTLHLAAGTWQIVAAKEGLICVAPTTVTVIDGPAQMEHRVAMQEAASIRRQ